MKEKICDTCKHFAKCEDICIKYSPTLIVTTYEDDDCDEWEKR